MKTFLILTELFSSAMVRVCLLTLLLPLVALSHPLVRSPVPFDCQDIYQNGSKHNGVYTIYPTTADQPVSVYCDMGCTEDDAHESHEGEWTVILKRVDGSVSFYRPWDDYKEGFGNKDGEYWLGLETIFRMTWAAKYELRVDMEDWQGGSVFAQYTSFSVESEDDGYRLRLGSYVDGGAGDAQTYVNGYKFSTYDKDQDAWSSTNCADTRKGGFWFRDCQYANPTGLYQKGINSQEGIHWYHWKTNYLTLRFMTMKIRRVTPPE